MTQSADELKPCPFCGGTAQIEGSEPNYSGTPQFWACCLGCAATGPWRKTEEGARLGWNTRPHMSMRAIDPPREHPPRRWQCTCCGQIGLYDDLRARECTYVYPPCKTCGQTPECAPNCGAVLDALGAPGVVVLDPRTEDPS